MLGCSTGYGLATRIALGFGYGTGTVGVSFEKAATPNKSGTPGFYNMGGESEGASETTIENNYFIVGEGGNWMDDGTGAIVFSYVNPSRPFTGGNALFRTYFSGNYYDKTRTKIKHK